jgi:hypothetical protein
MMIFLVFILWFINTDNVPIAIKPKVNHENYRAARYSMWIDFTKAQQIVPEIQYSIPGLSTLSYKYFIQYGRDTLIELIDPGNDIKSFTGWIKILDYAKKESLITCFIDQSRTFYTTKDSITYSIDECRGTVADLCKGVELNYRCDTVRYTLHIPETNYTVIFNDTIANLRSKGLFYPDIEYLPYQIIGIGPDKNTMTLEEVIYGKSAIDSLLEQYDYKGYLQITDADFSPADIQNVKDLIERYSKIK